MPLVISKSISMCRSSAIFFWLKLRGEHGESDSSSMDASPSNGLSNDTLEVRFRGNWGALASERITSAGTSIPPWQQLSAALHTSNEGSIVPMG
eukprot:Skav230767  [mRNA]  locus=C9027372:820:1101:- [translate_table: standard]